MVWSPLLQTKAEYIGNVASIQVKNESQSLMHLDASPTGKVKVSKSKKGKLSELETTVL
jgi:sporulation protein YlmC with PRC-barrel domain